MDLAGFPIDPYIPSRVNLFQINVILLGSVENDAIHNATPLEIQGGIWDLFKCCISAHETTEYRLGVDELCTEEFWHKAWRELVELREQRGPLPDFIFELSTVCYLPHIVHFYAKSREYAWNARLPRDYDRSPHKYPLLQVIDEWNFKACSQAYWDTNITGQVGTTRWGCVTDTGHFRASKKLETGWSREANLPPQKEGGDSKEKSSSSRHSTLQSARSGLRRIHRKYFWRGNTSPSTPSSSSPSSSRSPPPSYHTVDQEHVFDGDFTYDSDFEIRDYDEPEPVFAYLPPRQPRSSSRRQRVLVIIERGIRA
ncbi:hypothetical protein F4821DRAFT_278946 [Hypoxylon rubiginosum]|uniref:Uncharacterized protein n=1 Tax=Hypoxylon rubiginosum TaxID=110542 RepID=A0ACC0D0P0_9PEZI|nr:hypothetical protein F4821DRAFT_278946 [Hypoxylon rubiginosum]